jgi:holo-[acyl-carrier protein] synthase
MRVGIDLVRIEEVTTSLGRFGPRYLERIFTRGERADCLGETGEIASSSLAARFAAKEATLKVLRPTGRAVPWTSIEVRRVAGGWCQLKLSGAAAALAAAQSLEGLDVSLSHDGTYATAVVVAEERGGGHPVD